MRTEARHHLKEDPFAEGVREIFDWLSEHRTNILSGVLVAAIVVGGYLAWWNRGQNRDQQANLDLGKAVRTMNAPVGVPSEGGAETYSTIAARNAAAEKTLQDVVSQYGNTDAGRYAAYYLGALKMQEGDNDAAEKQLKQVASSNDANVAALAKMALAALYISSGKQDQAVPLCKELVDHPTATVPKEEAQLRLASAYAEKDPQAARKIYIDLAASDPNGPIASLANQRMAALKQ